MHSWHISGQCLQIPSEAKCFSEQAGLHSQSSRSKGLLQDRHLLALPVHVLQDPLHSLQVSESLKYPLLNENRHKVNGWSLCSYQTGQAIRIMRVYETFPTQIFHWIKQVSHTICCPYIPSACEQKMCIARAMKGVWPSFVLVPSLRDVGLYFFLIYCFLPYIR